MRLLIALFACALTSTLFAQTPNLQQVLTAGSSATTRPNFNGGINVLSGINLGNYSGTEKMNFLYNGAVGAGYQGSFDFLASGITEASFGKVANYGFYFSTILNHPMTFRTTNTDRLYITGDGNIGVGTITPQSKFDVNGQIRRSGIDPTFNPTVWNNVTGFNPEIGLYDSNNGSTGGLSLINNGYNLGVGISSYNRLITSHIGTSTFKAVQIHSPTTNERNYGITIKTNGATPNTAAWSDKTSTNSIASWNTPLNIGVFGDNDVKIFASSSSDPNVVPGITVKGITQYVGIGTTPSTTHRLTVGGSIAATRVLVNAGPWPDYVFKPDYQLPPLSAVAQYIKENGHLENIPSESEVKEKGIDVGDMHAKLLRKVEELTLYLIEQNKTIEAQQKRIEDLEKKVKE